MFLKQIKSFDKVAYVTLKRKTIRYSVFFIFLIKTWKFKEKKKKEKGFFSVFSFHFHVLNENEGKSKKYINFSWQFIFLSQNCINYPVSSVSWRINILSKKDHLYFSSEKRNICNFTKKVSFQRKS